MEEEGEGQRGHRVNILCMHAKYNIIVHVNVPFNVCCTNNSLVNSIKFRTETYTCMCYRKKEETSKDSLTN